jgi:CRISPR/Cas system endoribonuclease Cas6 (RAMP superfamily)
MSKTLIGFIISLLIYNFASAQNTPLDYPNQNKLAIIYFEKESQLQSADKFGINILHYLSDKMIAVISSKQEKWLNENGFSVQIIDCQPKSNLALYLVQSFIITESKSIAEYRQQQQSDFATLSPFGLVNEYCPGTYLLRTELKDISRLKDLGYEVLALQGKAYLP